MNAIKLPFQFDPEKLVDAYNSIDTTEFHEIHNNYVTPHKLRSIQLIDIDVKEKNHRFTPNERLKEMPYLMEVYETFKCEKETYRIHELLPDAFIKEHRDMNLNYENGSLRIHIPIVTNPEITMKVNGEYLVLKPGEAWYLDFDLPHEVSNPSSESRAHIIMDCLSNDWWDDLLAPFGKSRSVKQDRMSDTDKKAMEAQLKLMGLKIP